MKYKKCLVCDWYTDLEKEEPVCINSTVDTLYISEKERSLFKDKNVPEVWKMKSICHGFMKRKYP